MPRFQPFSQRRSSTVIELDAVRKIYQTGPVQVEALRGVSLSIEQNNFRGKGQTVRASADWSAYSKSVSAGSTRVSRLDTRTSAAATPSRSSPSGTGMDSVTAYSFVQA